MKALVLIPPSLQTVHVGRSVVTKLHLHCNASVWEVSDFKDGEDVKNINRFDFNKKYKYILFENGTYLVICRIGFHSNLQLNWI